MARTVAGLPAGTRITDFISLGVLAKTFPISKVQTAIDSSGKASIRERDLPAHVVVYYVLALALHMGSSYREVLRCLLEGVQWLTGGPGIRVTGKSGISQARTRLGSEPMLRLHDDVVGPIATPSTKGAWHKRWRIVSIDGSTLDVADEQENNRIFERPSAKRGESAFPQIRFVSLLESGTHVLFGTRTGGVRTSEYNLAKEVVPFLRKGMLCCADRGFYGFDLFLSAASTGADLLWRVKKNMILPRTKSLPDGSCLSAIYETQADRKAGRNGTTVRVIEYALDGIAGSEPVYRLITTILDPNEAKAEELAALYHERWEIETAFDELKTHLRGARVVLRSKTPDLVKQELYGLLMAHFAIRGIMHEAALRANEDPDRLSFIHAVRVVKRKMARFASLPPSGQESFS
jgi:hypothetical protein